MTTNFRTIIVRLYPTTFQKNLIDLTFDLCRRMYNKLLLKQNDIYYNYLKEKDTIKNVDIFFKNNKRCTVRSIKQANLKDGYYKVDSLALENEEKNLFNAFTMFFKNHAKYPKLKSFKDSNSYITRCVNDNIIIKENSIRLPKLGLIHAKGFNKKYSTCKIATVKVYEYKNGKYYAHITVKYEVCEKTITDVNTQNIVGLDFKIGNIFIASDNSTPNYSSSYYQHLNHLRKLEKALKFKSFGSISRKNHIIKIINIHKKIKNTRRDLLHKISNYLCNKYSSVIIESLNLKDISQKLRNGTNTYDTSYGNFTKMLSYKVKEYLIKIDKWFASSKLCSNCNRKKHNLTLNDRIYICDNCGLIIDRDLNAAINIKNEGLRMLKNL